MCQLHNVIFIIVLCSQGKIEDNEINFEDVRKKSQN